MTCQITHTPTVVLMAGLPGAGKTTLAHALGKDLHWPIIDKDKLKLSFLKTGMTDIQAGVLAYEAVFTLVRDLLVRQQLSVIIDSATLHLFILEHVTEIACAAHAQLKIILCIIESHIRAQRLSQRTTDFAQHVAEPVTLEQDLRRFAHLPPGFLTLHTLSSPEECLARAKLYITAS